MVVHKYLAILCTQLILTNLPLSVSFIFLGEVATGRFRAVHDGPFLTATAGTSVAGTRDGAWRIWAAVTSGGPGFRGRALSARSSSVAMAVMVAVAVDAAAGMTVESVWLQP